MYQPLDSPGSSRYDENWVQGSDRVLPPYSSIAPSSGFRCRGIPRPHIRQFMTVVEEQRRPDYKGPYQAIDGYSMVAVPGAASGQ
ncbi:hypothetical protein PG996_015743 [Apiospora saccharicola]|uniref:Uncharacterized protein n=1 Tax=Apiospora saccharicola TaxID=335842 RepID=A0ABR1TM36_9PEZI